MKKSSILERLIERLDKRIERLQEARKRVQGMIDRRADRDKASGSSTDPH